MTRRGCASLFGGSILLILIAGLILFGPRSCADGLLPRESFEDKDVDLLISKLKSWRVSTLDRAALQLKDRTEDRDKIAAALTHTLLTDSHETVRASAAYALGRLKPPAAEAVPARNRHGKLSTAAWEIEVSTLKMRPNAVGYHPEELVQIDITFQPDATDRADT